MPRRRSSIQGAPAAGRPEPRSLIARLFGFRRTASGDRVWWPRGGYGDQPHWRVYISGHRDAPLSRRGRILWRAASVFIVAGLAVMIYLAVRS